jgi:hypothetical protein
VQDGFTATSAKNPQRPQRKFLKRKKSAEICAEDPRKSAGNTSAPKTCSNSRRVFPQNTQIFPQISADIY